MTVALLVEPFNVQQWIGLSQQALCIKTLFVNEMLLMCVQQVKRLT